MPSRPKILLSLAVPLCVVFFLGIPWLASYLSKANATNSSNLGYTVQLVPDRLTLAGDVATQVNTVGFCTETWLSNTPTGTIILGVDPHSCNTDDWGGGSATAEVFLTDIYSPTVFVLKLSWPDRDGKGLHSPDQNRDGIITLDNQSLWNKRTTRLSTSGDYYAAEHEPILTTIVVTQSITHTLNFSVPARTAWDLSRIELIAYPYHTTIRGIGYSPLRDCQYPGGDLQPSGQDIQEDMFRLFHTCNAIRTYSVTGVGDQILKQANAVGLPAYAGVWMDGVVSADEQEVQALIDLAGTTDMAGVIVGNEYYLRHRTITDINYLQQRIIQVKEGIPESVPVTTAEIDGLMFIWDSLSDLEPEINPAYRSILDELDFIMVHIYPFWNGMPIDGAAVFTVQRYKAIQTLIEQEYSGQNKWVVIGETGWPSGGSPNGSAVPSLHNQERYVLEFLSLAEQNEVEFMYFDAFDELWKIEEPGRVGQHWGYSYGDRAAKHYFYGVLIPSLELLFHKVYLPSIIRGSATATSHSSVDLAKPLSSQHSIQASTSVTFPVYIEWLEGNFASSGWMGDVDNIDMYECDRSNPHSCEMSLRISFSPTGTLGWGGVYWQHPSNNWGTLGGGYDLTGASRLAFWARGDRGGEVVEFLVGGLGAPTDPYSDTIQPARSTGSIMLSDIWQQFEINLTDADLSRVIGGFAWVASSCYNSEPIKFYLDDIIFDFDPTPDPLPPPTRGPFYVYENDGSGCNHFIPSGWMGDIGDIFLNHAWTGAPYMGTTAISVTYSAQGSNGQNWAGVYWQHPENNWGTLKGGYDLTGATRLTFWARGDQGGEVVEFLVGGLGDPTDPYSDTIQPARSSGLIVLSDTWRQVEIDLTGADLGRVIGGFAWVASRANNNGPITFYLDDIAYRFDQNMRKRLMIPE